MATSIEGMCVSKRCDRSCSVFAGLLLCQGARYAVRHIYLTSTSLSLSMRLSPSIAHVINHVNDECWFCLLFFDQNCWCEESQLKTAKFKVLLSRESLAHTHANDSFYWFFPTMLFLSSSNFFIGREQKSNEKERKKLFVTSLTLRQVREIATGATKRHRRNEWKSTKKKEQ